MFKRDVHHYHIVEVEKGSKLPELTGDLRESLKSLGNHPGFQYLLLRNRFKKAGLRNAMDEGLALTETQLRYLQAGIYWAGELEREHALLTREPVKTVPADSSLEDAFNKIRSDMEIVGE